MILRAGFLIIRHGYFFRKSRCTNKLYRQLALFVKVSMITEIAEFNACTAAPNKSDDLVMILFQNVIDYKSYYDDSNAYSSMGKLMKLYKSDSNKVWLYYATLDDTCKKKFLNILSYTTSALNKLDKNMHTVYTFKINYVNEDSLKGFCNLEDKKGFFSNLKMWALKSDFIELVEKFRSSIERYESAI
ncbi:Uncharacterised protein [Candidatus Tiddalikarchaeum anstoanum]|nr:Uncharacterised protein [Candidatus Tiddalikarchaeum anstoanum]